MTPLISYPWALAGLAALPALVAIYVLRNRFRPRPVSSLALWAEQREASEGGQRRRRLQTPLSFFLELLGLALITLAATDPQLPLTESSSPIVVVLDDSISMRAGGDDSPRARAENAVREELPNHQGALIRWVLARRLPQTLGEPTRSPAEATRLLSEWTCSAPTANLERAISLALELGGPYCRVLAVTDQPPPEDWTNGRVEWWAFGRAVPNVAITQATRSNTDDRERLLFEVANFAGADQTTRLTVQSTTSGATIKSLELALRPMERRRWLVELDAGASTIQASLPEDPLVIDNKATLLPIPKKPVRAKVALSNARLAAAVKDALEATKNVVLVEDRVELAFVDAGHADHFGPGAWTMTFSTPNKPTSYIGPFVLDRRSPLTRGLSLEGVIWGASADDRLPGVPTIAAGNVLLVTDVLHASGAHDIRASIHPDYSTALDAPAWPELIWNLVSWRADQAPGIREPNLPLGANASLTLPIGTERVALVRPNGKAQELATTGTQVALACNDIGVSVARVKDREFSFAVNALAPEESDLTKRVSGRWGDWSTGDAAAVTHRSVAWALLLLALGVLIAHGFLVLRVPPRSA